jgi:hypothetical protein
MCRELQWSMWAALPEDQSFSAFVTCYFRCGPRLLENKLLSRKRRVPGSNFNGLVHKAGLSHAKASFSGLFFTLTSRMRVPVALLSSSNRALRLRNVWRVHRCAVCVSLESDCG